LDAPFFRKRLDILKSRIKEDRQGGKVLEITETRLLKKEKNEKNEK